MYPTSSGLIRASFSAPAIARPAPCFEGITISAASDVMANPLTSARISAPRARACSYSSNTKIAAPSPWTMPLRLALKGRQASLDITRRPSQAFTPPKHSMLSDPPVIIAVDMPERTMAKACAIAWFEDAQAVETVKLGPFRLNSIDTWLAAALFISFGTTKGCTRFLPSS